VSLQDGLKSGWLTRHKTSRQEIVDLLAVDRDLADCRAAGLSPEWRLNIAYNAALQAATVALSAAGYRATRESHHLRVIQSLAYTVGASEAVIRTFDQLRKERNIAGYERVGSVSDHEAKEMIVFAGRLRKQVLDWLREAHPGLLGK